MMERSFDSERSKKHDGKKKNKRSPSGEESRPAKKKVKTDRHQADDWLDDLMDDDDLKFRI